MFKSRICLVTLGILGLLAPVSVQADEGDVVAVFKLKGELSESPAAMNPFQMLSGERSMTMFDLLQRLRQARGDGSVQAVVFDIQESSLGFAQIQELREQFKGLQSAGKDVWVFCEYLDNRVLLLGSAANHLVLMPTGEVFFTGLYSEGLYFKALLDKIGVQADILHCGAYKAAGEPLCRTGPSKEAEEQMNWLFDSIFEQLISNIAESRKLTPEAVRGIVDKCSLGAQEALELKLVDKLQYREDFIDSVKRQYGEGTKVVKEYGKDEGPEVDFNNPFGIFQLFSDMMKPKKKADKAAVAIVFVEGLITTGATEPSMFGGSSNAGSATIRKAIADAAADESVKALVLRVDSGGGSAIASDVICEASKRFKESDRPFVVSMGNVAGSGGYYVAALGDTIFAQPTTITGSIGVVGGKLVTKGLWDWAGLDIHEYKRGQHADLFNTNRVFTEEERGLMERLMDRVYKQFKGRVLEGRADRIKGDLEALAGGRVYTGEQALDKGLVDKLGGFADAIKFAASEAELGTKYEVRVFPRPKNFFELLAEAFGQKDEDEEFDAGQAGVGGRLGLARLPHLAASLEAVKTLDPEKGRALEDFLAGLELLSGESVLVFDANLATLQN